MKAIRNKAHIYDGKRLVCYVTQIYSEMEVEEGESWLDARGRTRPIRDKEKADSEHMAEFICQALQSYEAPE